MTKLEMLHLVFHDPQSLPDPASRPPPPPPRFVLPALTDLMFRGVYAYLEDLLARIDAPLLDCLLVMFFKALNFGIPQLHRLISHAEHFKAFDHAEVLILSDSILLDLYPQARAVNHRRRLAIGIDCTELGSQLSSLTQLCSPSFSLISALKELKIVTESEYLSSSHRQDDTENTQWVKFLEPFTAVKNLYLMDEIARRVCGALQELSRERVTEVLPSLRNLFVYGSQSFEHIQEAMRPFIAARDSDLSGHCQPVAIRRWRR